MTMKSSITDTPTKKTSSIRKALPQVLATGVKNVLLLGFGMTLGFPTILIPGLSGGDPDEKISLGDEALSWIGSLNLICVPIGCLLTGALTQPLGRKRAMQIVNIPFVVSWIIFYASTEVWQIFLALCLTGVTGGLLEAPTLTYVAEITTPGLRGILASTSTVAVIVGILTQFLLGTFLRWRTVAIVSCVVPIVSFLLLFFVPESPHWLISKNKLQEAQSNIAWLRGWTTSDAVQCEFDELCMHLSKGADEPELTLKDKIGLFKEKSFLWPFGVVSLMFFLGHFCGMTTLQTYAVKIFSTLEAPVDKYYATIFLGVAEVSGCMLSACLVHYIGKRKMNFFSMIGCGVCFVVVAVYAFVKGVKHLEEPTNNLDQNNPHKWVPMVFLIAAAFCSHAGIRILPWMLVGEVYSNRTRAVASGFSGGVSYIFGFLSNKVFFALVTVLTLPGMFSLYACVCFVGFVAIYFILPETEGKTLHEIVEHFAGNGELDNKVKKGKKSGSRAKGEVNAAFEDENKNNESRF